MVVTRAKVEPASSPAPQASKSIGTKRRRSDAVPQHKAVEALEVAKKRASLPATQVAQTTRASKGKGRAQVVTRSASRAPVAAEAADTTAAALSGDATVDGGVTAPQVSAAIAGSSQPVFDVVEAMLRKVFNENIKPQLEAISTRLTALEAQSTQAQSTLDSLPQSLKALTSTRKSTTSTSTNAAAGPSTGTSGSTSTPAISARTQASCTAALQPVLDQLTLARQSLKTQHDMITRDAQVINSTHHRQSNLLAAYQEGTSSLQQELVAIRYQAKEHAKEERKHSRQLKAITDQARMTGLHVETLILEVQELRNQELAELKKEVEQARWGITGVLDAITRARYRDDAEEDKVERDAAMDKAVRKVVVEARKQALKDENRRKRLREEMERVKAERVERQRQREEARRAEARRQEEAQRLAEAREREEELKREQERSRQILSWAVDVKREVKLEDAYYI